MRLLLPLLFCTLPASAVVVRGKVSGPLGQPVQGARVQLILGQRSVADAVSGPDGTYELRSNAAGRFLLLTSSAQFAPQIGDVFYGGRTDILENNILLDRASITPVETTLPSGLLSSLAPLADPPAQVPADRLLPDALLPSELPLAPASFLLETGQTGQPAYLFLRGAGPEANAILYDGIAVQDLGGRFNFGTVSSTGFSALAADPVLEMEAGPNPVRGVQAEAGLVSLSTPAATSLRPRFGYSGEGGTLHTWRDEATLALTRLRADLLLSASRLDTSNALANDRFHVATLAGNGGYRISGKTGVRLTARQEASAAPLPIAYNLGFSAATGLATRDAAQNLYTSFLFDTRTAGDWHNQLRAGSVRKREQVFVYAPGTAHIVSLSGANGSNVAGLATVLPMPAREDFATNRDEIGYTSDYPLTRFLSGVLNLRYENVRALDQTTSFRETAKRENFTAALSLASHFRQRLFAEASGDVNHSNLLGYTGDPRLGLTYVPVLPGVRRFRGTVLHALAATGTREPGLQEQEQGAAAASRARTFEFSADQTLLGPKLILHAGYFHNHFSHQVEALAPAPLVLSQTLAYRTQGLVTEVRYSPRQRLFVRGGYTYLASLVERSAAVPVFSASFPGTPIALSTALAGQRLFHRPPHSGFFDVQYSGTALTANLRGSLVGRSDDSTGNPTLLLPNRNLGFAYARLDASLAYVLTRHLTVTAQALNLLGTQHTAPIGYPSAPFTVRAGVRLRLGGE